MTVKKCKVLNTNDYCVAVEFGEEGAIQLPFPNVAKSEVFVKKVDGIFSLTSQDEYEKFVRNTVAENQNKKTNIELGVVKKK